MTSKKLLLIEDDRSFVQLVTLALRDLDFELEVADDGLVALNLLAAFDVFTPLALFGPMAGIAFAHGLILPGAMASVVSVRPNLAGAASGVSGAMQVAFGAIITVLVARHQDDSQWPMILIMTACGAMGLAACRQALALERASPPTVSIRN